MSQPIKPDPPDLPAYLLDPLQKQSPKKLEQVATYARKLATYKRNKQHLDEMEQRREDEISNDELEELEERDVSTDPDDYDEVPGGAYVTIKQTNESEDGSTVYNYYYWQWRDGDSWKNKYIAPVNPKE